MNRDRKHDDSTIDERIRRALESESAEIDRIAGSDPGLAALLSGSLHSGMRRWVLLGNLLAVAATVVIVWTGWQFFSAATTESMLRWGVGLVVAVQMQIAIKQWLWMEMQRTATLREIKRVEVAVARIVCER
jgi:hypothetical protein